MKENLKVLIIEFRKALKASDDAKCQQLRDENPNNQKFLAMADRFSGRFNKRRARRERRRDRRRDN